MSETKMVIAAIEALNALPDVLAFRNNTGQARIHGFRVRFGLGNGSADVIAVLGPWGHFMGLEGKKPGEGADPAQLEWAADLIAAGGTYRVFHTVAEALAVVGEVRKTLLTSPPDINVRATSLSTIIDRAQSTGSMQSTRRRNCLPKPARTSKPGQSRPAPESSAPPIVGRGGTHGDQG